MKVGDVIRHEGIKYTITLFYAPIYINGVQVTPEHKEFNYKIVNTCLEDISDYENIKVTAVNNDVKPPIYVHIPIENVTPIRNYIKAFQKADGPWSAFQLALNFPTTSYMSGEQESYESQHAGEQVLWLESDLVPNPK